MKKVPASEAIKMLAIGRTTFYKYTNTLGIQPEKNKGKALYSIVDIQRIQAEIDGIQITDEQREQKTSSSEHHEQARIEANEHKKKVEATSEVITAIKEIYESQISGLKTELAEEREGRRKDSQQSALLLGQAKAEADQAQKEILRLREITEAPPEPEVEPVKKPWWLVWK